MHVKNVLLVALTTFLVNSASAAISIEINVLNTEDKADACLKYTSKGNDFLRITHARILEVDPNRRNKIIGNHLCDFREKKGPKYEATCQTNGVATFKNFVILISVTAEEGIMLSQVEYRYVPKVMKLSDKLTMEKLKNLKFNHEQHIQPTEIKISGTPEGEIVKKIGSCHEAYPTRLIGDHGIYGLEYKKTDDSATIGWKRMYFDPAGIGESLFL